MIWLFGKILRVTFEDVEEDKGNRQRFFFLIGGIVELIHSVGQQAESFLMTANSITIGDQCFLLLLDKMYVCTYYFEKLTDAK